MRYADLGRKSYNMVKTGFQDESSGGGGQGLLRQGAEKTPFRFPVTRRIEEKQNIFLSHAKWIWTAPWRRYRHLPWLGPELDMSKYLLCLS